MEDKNALLPEVVSRAGVRVEALAEVREGVSAQQRIRRGNGTLMAGVFVAGLAFALGGIGVVGGDYLVRAGSLKRSTTDDQDADDGPRPPRLVEMPESIQALEELLSQHSSADLELWGSGNTKPVGEFYTEIVNGGSTLAWTFTADGPVLRRCVRVLRVSICAGTTRGRRYLCCTQIIDQGGTKEVERLLAKKAAMDEVAEDLVDRALRTELEAEPSVVLLIKSGIE